MVLSETRDAMQSPSPLTPADITSALAFMGWEQTPDMAAKVAVAINAAGSLQALTDDMDGRFELTAVERAVLRYAEALRLAADPRAAAETLALEAGCDQTDAQKHLAEAAYRQSVAAVRLGRGDVKGALEDQTRATRETALASKRLALAAARRERAAGLISVAA